MLGHANLSQATCIEDLRLIAQRSVPRAFFQYADHGSYAQVTLRENIQDLATLRLRQRVAVNVADRDLTTKIAGEVSALPFTLAPIGLCGMQWKDGEIAACQAAHAAGIQFCLSTMSICSIEDVASAVRAPFWFQLYVMRDRGFVQELIQRAVAAKCSVLMPTLDLQVMGARHCDVKNGMTVPPRLTVSNALDTLSKPKWALGILRGRRKTFGNLAGYIKGMDNVSSLSQWIGKQFDPTLNWKDIEWIRDRWPGRLILKGILDVEDAKLAQQLGVTAIVVSNHGGRQLDGAPSSIASLPAIVDAIGGDTEIIFDGGIRSGQDVMRALALGARSCLIGRAYTYGLGAGGQAGVARAIDIIRNELDVSMALTGMRSINQIDRQVLVRREQRI
jgi:L-lactate dehydrogenase (cytochrome)